MLGIPYQLVSREATPEAISYQELTREVIESHPLIVNTTPLGTSPHTEAFPSDSLSVDYKSAPLV